MSSHGWWCNSKTFPTTCPFCGEDVFFFSCNHGSRVYFDELGGWEIHGCFVDYTGIVPRPAAQCPIPLRQNPADSIKDGSRFSGTILKIRQLIEERYEDRRYLSRLPNISHKKRYFEIQVNCKGFEKSSPISFYFAFNTQEIEELPQHLGKTVTFTIRKLKTEKQQQFLLGQTVELHNTKRKKTLNRMR